jgi:ribosome-associated translation inhibitor RaiA
MQIQLNTGHGVESSDGLAAHVQKVVEHELAHFSVRISRVEVHITDENGGKSGPDDKRCVMEARIEHHEPTAVTEHASSVHQAVDGAAGKLARAVQHVLAKADSRKPL